ncbi:MAG: hypothetical protein ACI8QS_000282 [Planctomycetota bacterium]
MTRKARRVVSRKETGKNSPKSVGSSHKNSNGKRNANGRSSSSGRADVAGNLDRIPTGDLRELYALWTATDASDGHADAASLRRDLTEMMTDGACVEEHVSQLNKRQLAVFEDLLSSSQHRKPYPELASARSLSFLNDMDLEACISDLARRGLVVDAQGSDFADNGHRLLAIPEDLAEGLVQRRRDRVRGIFGLLTLKGHLDQVYSDPERAKRITPQRLRELYKMYSQETAAVARIERLPEGIRGLVEKAILEFGGVLPRQLFERMETELPHWNGRRWRMILEQSLIGTVRELDLTSYGVQQQDETLIVFNEVSLAWLRRVAVPGDPDRPDEELSLGIDVASNVSRFLAYLDENDVRYTVKGEIFKTTEKRIVQHLIPNPGREVSREEVLSFILRFAKDEELIDRTGKRTITVTGGGREWSGRQLFVKHRRLLDFATDDLAIDGEPFHHRRIRQIFLRLLKRVNVGVWYDLMYLPFLARNSYLSALDELGIEEQLAERTHGGRYPVMEDPQRLAWNLVKWVRKRLYLLGVVDLGYDSAKHPVAMRLTPQGARLLGTDRIGPDPPRSGGSIVVTPDFEVVLFPTGDDSRLVHDLDRFCTREKLSSLMHFSITQDSVRRALRDGMSLSLMLEVLDTNSRTPVPQNVAFSVRDWSVRAGLLFLSQDLILRGEDPEILRNFRQDPGTRPYMEVVLGENAVKLKGKVTPMRMRALLRELGHLVELGGEVSN